MDASLKDSSEHVVVREISVTYQLPMTGLLNKIFHVVWDQDTIAASNARFGEDRRVILDVGIKTAGP